MALGTRRSERSINAVKVIAVCSLVEFTFADINDGRGESIDAEFLVTICGANRIKRTRRVQPTHVSNETLFAKYQFLPANAKFKAVSFFAAEFDIGLPQVESVFVWRAVGFCIAAHDLGVLCLENGPQP